MNPVNTAKTISIALVVILPTLLLLLFSFDARLMLGSDVFVFSGLQLLFLGIYVGVRRFRARRGTGSLAVTAVE